MAVYYHSLKLISCTFNIYYRWLNNLGLSAYVDNFHQQGLYNMFELQEFTLEDLQKMKIGTAHRNKIWRSLVEFRNSDTFMSTQTQNMQRSSSNASTVSMQSGTGYCPGYYEVTRYTFKHTISLNKGDHDYCGQAQKNADGQQVQNAQGQHLQQPQMQQTLQ